MSSSDQLDLNARIRLALPGDGAAMAQVLAEAFAEFRPAYTPGAFAATTPSAEQIEARFREGPIWVAAQQGVIVGTVSAVPKGEALYIRSLAVLPAARGQHLGEALVQQAERHGVARGFRRLVLSTTPVLTGAIRLYEQLGFVRSSEGPQDLFGTPLFTMVKELA